MRVGRDRERRGKEEGGVGRERGKKVGKEGERERGDEGSRVIDKVTERESVPLSAISHPY